MYANINNVPDQCASGQSTFMCCVPYIWHIVCIYKLYNRSMWTCIQNKDCVSGAGVCVIEFVAVTVAVLEKNDGGFQENRTRCCYFLSRKLYILMNYTYFTQKVDGDITKLV